MFGGVDALVESQDWWLRDQASLAVGFDNWMGGGNGDLNNGAATSGINMSGTTADLDAMAGMGSGFYMPRGGNRGGGNRGGGGGGGGAGGGDVYPDDDWTTYN